MRPLTFTVVLMVVGLGLWGEAEKRRETTNQRIQAAKEEASGLPRNYFKLKPGIWTVEMIVEKEQHTAILFKSGPYVNEYERYYVYDVPEEYWVPSKRFTIYGPATDAASRP